MTARQLARILAQDDPARIVVVASKDAAGRTVYLPVHSVSTTCYDAKRREIGLESLTPQAVALGYTDDDVLVKARAAVVLSP